MPLTKLDQKPALIVIDLQKGIVVAPTAHPIDDVVQNSARLASEFRRRDLPVALINVSGGAPGRTDAAGPGGERPEGWDELVPELDARPDDILVTKKTWGAFHATPLHERLSKLGVTQVVLTGIATSIGVESTARSAFEHGYHVVLATDAMTDMIAEAHRNSLELIFPRLGESATTAEILEQLEASN